MPTGDGPAAPAVSRPVTRGPGVYVLDAGIAAPRRLTVPGKRLSRFMDAIYLDRPSEKLDVKQIRTLNAARRPLLLRSDVRQTNESVRSALAAGVRAADTGDVLEWGCGYHPMRTHLGRMRYTGLDIDPLVIRHNRRLPWRRAFVLADADLDRLRNDGFDTVVSAFVFHFRLSRLHIATMRRVLRPGGIVLANVYRRSAPSRRDLRAAFEQVGFAVHVRPDPAATCAGHDFWAMSFDPAGKRRANRALDAVESGMRIHSRPA